MDWYNLSGVGGDEEKMEINRASYDVSPTTAPWRVALPTLEHVKSTVSYVLIWSFSFPEACLSTHLREPQLAGGLPAG